MFYPFGMTYYVYILASRKHGTLYIGRTNNLARRLFEHQSGEIEGFTKKYNVHRLVWFEGHDDLDACKQRERNLKKWKRAWKVQLIEEGNPEWDDLEHVLAP